MQYQPKILIIDDERDVRETVFMMLEQGNFELREASDGERGLCVLAAFEPDLVITDIIMPEKEGIETIVEIRKQLPTACIVAMSGGGRTNNLDFLKIAKRMGADDIIAKPFTATTLLSKVERLLARHLAGER